MALSGLQIFKLLPGTNCKECGKPTCLAFAMLLAQKKADLSECPDATEEAKETLASAAAPPLTRGGLFSARVKPLSRIRLRVCKRAGFTEFTDYDPFIPQILL